MLNLDNKKIKKINDVKKETRSTNRNDSYIY